MTIRRTFWGVLIVMLLAAAAAWFIPRTIFAPTLNPSTGNLNEIEILTRVVILIAALIVVAWAWTALSLVGFTMIRDARVSRQQVGQIFEERYRVLNMLPLARLWVEVRDESELPGRFGSRVLSLIGPKQQRGYAAYTMLNRRGRFQLGPTTILSGDPFGLFLRSKRIAGRQELLVLPYVVDLDTFPSPRGQFPGGKAILQKATEVTPQSAGVREYMPGDGLRSIHWPTSARRDRLMVKEYEQDPQADVWIFLDADKSAHNRGQVDDTLERIDQLWLWKYNREDRKVTLPPDTFEYGVSAAGSIASYYLRHGRAVGLVCASEVVTVLPPERGERQLNKILENLAFLKCDGKLPLLGLVEAESPQLPRASTVVVITPSVDPTVEVAVDALLVRRMRPVVVSLDVKSFGEPVDTAEFLARLQSRSVPVVVVRKDEPLQESLERVETF